MFWLLATRTAKLLPHLWYQPEHIIYVPAFIVFGYYFALMKIYALFTLHETGWGTRAGIGDPVIATAAAAKAVFMPEKDDPYEVPETQSHPMNFEPSATEMNSGLSSQAVYGSRTV